MATHWIYHVYTLGCTVQLPLYVALIAAGYSRHHYCGILEERGDLFLWGSNTTTLGQQQQQQLQLSVFNVKRQSLDWEMGGMCALAGLFAVVYMLLTGMEDAENETSDIQQRLRARDDASHCAEGGEEEGQDDGCSAMVRRGCRMPSICLDEVVRVTFWVFVWCQSFVQTAENAYARRGGPLERLWLLSCLRCVALFGLCRTSLREQRPVAQACAVGAYLGWIGLCLSDTTRYDGRATWRWLLPQAAIGDTILVLGHRWDRYPPSMVVILNCRLFFVAFTSLLTQLAPLLA
jgi:hypothetical protein